MSALSDVSLRKEIAPYSDEVSPLCHANNARFLPIVTSNQDHPMNTLGRTEDLETLSTSLDPITHIDDLGE